MSFEPTSKEEQADLVKRIELQAKLQSAVRASAPASEMRRIQAEIEALNRKLEAYSVRDVVPKKALP